VVWSDVASAKPNSRLRRRDLDSEGANEGSRFYRRPSGIRTQTEVARRCRHLITRNNNRMARALVRRVAPQVLSHDDGAAERYRPAVVTPRHAWRRADVLLMAAGSCGLDRVAPHLAQQHGLLTHADHQRDRKNKCSKHVELAIRKGKSCANSEQGLPPRTLRFLPVLAVRRDGPGGFRQRSAENPAGPAGHVQRSAARVLRFSWHRSCGNEHASSVERGYLPTAMASTARSSKRRNGRSIRGILRLR
jgi:hypothetical protein